MKGFLLVVPLLLTLLVSAQTASAMCSDHTSCSGCTDATSYATDNNCVWCKGSNMCGQTCDDVDDDGSSSSSSGFVINSNQCPSEGLSTMIIVWIVIGCVAFCVCLGCCGCCQRRRYVAVYQTPAYQNQNVNQNANSTNVTIVQQPQQAQPQVVQHVYHQAPPQPVQGYPPQPVQGYPPQSAPGYPPQPGAGAPPPAYQESAPLLSTGAPCTAAPQPTYA